MVRDMLKTVDYLSQMLAFINKARCNNTCGLSNQKHNKKQEQLNELSLTFIEKTM